MKGPEVRAALHDDRLSLLKHSFGCRLIDELGVVGGVADIGVVAGGELWGYEIKGETDTCKRLETQIAAYNGTFQRITLAGSRRNVEAARGLVPEWWGLLVVDAAGFDDLRRPAANPEWIAKNVLALLWKAELTKLAKEYALPASVLRMSNYKMAAALGDTLPRRAVPSIVSDALAGREGWGKHPRKNLA